MTDATEAKRRDYLRLVGQVADWKAEADRLQRIAVARGEEGDALERERDAALQERDAALAQRDALAECSVEQLAREAALSEAHREEKERADLLAEALHGAYVTEHRWRGAYEEAVSDRDHLREVIEFVLTEHHLGYCTLTTDTLTILTAARGCLKEEEEEGPSLTNVTVGEKSA